MNVERQRSVSGGGMADTSQAYSTRSLPGAVAVLAERQQNPGRGLQAGFLLQFTPRGGLVRLAGIGKALGDVPARRGGRVTKHHAATVRHQYAATHGMGHGFVKPSTASLPRRHL